jgi:hypothetical protein
MKKCVVETINRYQIKQTNIDSYIWFKGATLRLQNLETYSLKHFNKNQVKDLKLENVQRIIRKVLRIKLKIERMWDFQSDLIKEHFQKLSFLGHFAH